ncbi:unnamed protein product [Cuscuta europaea]|uniref:Uncharacterized protein n=1 Tax=Cuscuta europaea TaxID=41803 RepID=A0A9P1E311_CUSEU|nr:unnamed protein product [Cuscuta europaea]
MDGVASVGSGGDQGAAMSGNDGPSRMRQQAARAATGGTFTGEGGDGRHIHRRGRRHTASSPVRAEAGSGGGRFGSGGGSVTARVSIVFNFTFLKFKILEEGYFSLLL